jgi:hypothetical protein
VHAHVPASASTPAPVLRLNDLHGSDVLCDSVWTFCRRGVNRSIGSAISGSRAAQGICTYAPCVAQPCEQAFEIALSHFRVATCWFSQIEPNHFALCFNKTGVVRYTVLGRLARCERQICISESPAALAQTSTSIKSNPS